MNSPLFSIILPTYNRRLLLQRAIESVIAQEYTQWELIIIDDGSTDQTQEYIKTIEHDQITYIYQENKGRSTARNCGLLQCNGDYICFLDSDDQLLPNYLSIFNSIRHSNNHRLMLAGINLIDVDSIKSVIPSPYISLCIIQCLEGCFNLMPFCFHNSIISSAKFDEELYYGEDYSFFIPLIVKNEIEIIETATSIVHQHSNRTINKVFNNTEDGYNQLQKSVISIIDENFEALSKFVSRNKLVQIKKNKIKQYILSAAKINFSETKMINQKQKIVSISNIRLLVQRAKGLVQSKI